MNSVTEIREIAARIDAGASAHSHVFGAFRYRTCLIMIFLLSLPFVNSWIHGDGVGYYAFLRAPLINHSLRFEKDWLAANPAFLLGRVDKNGHLVPQEFTPTGYVRNHFTVGPAILWAPFFLLTHSALLVADHFGAHVATDGFARPYVLTIALATALYGFAGLLLAFDLARRHFDERWAFLATLGIWFASSLPVYMYMNPSWSHAHSAFATALFLWYWHRTRDRRSLAQWCLLAAIAGLMMNIYYPNVFLLLVPGVEAVAGYATAFGSMEGREAHKWVALLGGQVLFVSLAVLALAPTLLTRWIMYGNAFETGYPPMLTWNWGSPAFRAVLFSANHGMLSWTPILIPAVAGLFLFCTRDRIFGLGLLLSFAAFYYFIASYPSWDGLSSFGNRFFVSLTPLFVIGLTATLGGFARLWRHSNSNFAVASGAVALLVLWNAGLVFQWGTQMIPARGAISWSEVVHNQYAEVPGRVTTALSSYFLRRGDMMREIERINSDRLIRAQKAPMEAH